MIFFLFSFYFYIWQLWDFFPKISCVGFALPFFWSPSAKIWSPKGQLGCMDCSHFQDSCYYLATSFKIWRISLIGIQKVAKKPQEHHSFIYLFIYLFMFGFDFLKEIWQDAIILHKQNKVCYTQWPCH
jgi:hypothetical protein